MNVLIAAAWYVPEALGGTEQYVRALARHLRSDGVNVTIAVPTTDRAKAAQYDVDGVVVRRFLVDGDEDPRLAVNREAPASWRTLLDEVRPDVVDLHSLTTHLGLAHVRAAKQAGARTLTTLHLPGLICARGTLMRFGETPCDGNLSTQPCTACRLQAHGLPTVIGRALSLVPSDFGRGVARTSFPRALQRPFTASLAHDDRIALLGALAEQSDVIVSLSDWQAEMLVRNGVPRAKLAVCRQGVTDDVIRRARPVRSPDAPLRVGYVGRYDDVKGVHVLVDAVMQLLMGPAGSLGPGPAEAARPESAQVPAGPGGRANRSGLELHLWGVARTPEARIYQDVIRRQCDGVPSITMHAESTADAIYQQIDVLAVPSLWFETGPLVVLEAHAAGVPVVGSNLGGIAERIRHGVDGLLVPPDDADALSSALRSLMVDRALLDRLRPNGPVRRMKDAADETHERYSQLLSPVSV